METLSNTSIKNFRYLTVALLLGFMIMVLAGSASAQGQKGKRGDKIPQATLKEAKVTARVITTVEEVSPMKVKLNVLNPTGKTVRISILNFSNEPVFQDAFAGKEYNKVLNFSSTASGRYKLLVNSPKQSETRRFAINSKESRNLNQSEMAQANNTDVIASIHKTAPTIVRLHLVNNTGERVDYVFRNTAREIIHSGSVHKPQFNKLFDMTKVTDGKYTLEVKYQTDKVASRTFDMQTVYDRSFAWTDKKGRALKPANPTPLTQRTAN